MKKIMPVLVLALQLWLGPSAFAAVNTSQVTGSIVEVTDKMIVVQKADERWEIARDDNTKVKGKLKVGQKVTIHYRMVATDVETKPSSSTTK